MNLYTIGVTNKETGLETEIPIAAPDIRKAIATAAFATEKEHLTVTSVELAARDVPKDQLPEHALWWTEDDGISYNFIFR
jgi:hypothetical protein